MEQIPADSNAGSPAERALRESEARTRAILDTAVDAIITIDQAGTIESVNSAAERLFGYSRNELIGQNVKLLMPSPYRDEHDDYLRNYLQHGRRKIIGIGREVVGRRRNGSLFPMHLAVSEFWLGDRRMFTGITRDMTDVKQAINELEENESRTRAILDAAVDAIITIDERGTIETVNHATERLFGYTMEDLIGKPVKLLLPEPYHEQFDSCLVNDLRTGQKKTIGSKQELYGRRKDDSIFPIELVVSEVWLGNRRLFTSFIRDLTERREAEQQLRFYAAELQGRNADLTRSNQELDDFAYIASHDLKEPLRGLHNYATFLIEDYHDKLDDAGRAKLETLQTLTQRMDSLLDSLLEFSRVGRLSFAFMETDLQELVAEVLDSLRITIQERSVEVRIPRPLPRVRCDRVRIGEVFRNFITNALKYNDKATPWIELGFRTSHELPSAVPEDRANNTNAEGLTFYVRDNGIGIRDKHFEGIFRIFKRLHGRDKFGGGTGVGLTIIKKIVERHGGRVWLESELGVGTTFYFTLSSGG